jgi:hypothetical protein
MFISIPKRQLFFGFLKSNYALKSIFKAPSSKDFEYVAKVFKFEFIYPIIEPCKKRSLNPPMISELDPPLNSENN